jgi:DNA replication protein DnaC
VSAWSRRAGDGAECIAHYLGILVPSLPTYTHPTVLVVDEVAYLTYGTDAANILFHVVNERHRRYRPMISTTNKSLRDWDRVLHD